MRSFTITRNGDDTADWCTGEHPDRTKNDHNGLPLASVRSPDGGKPKSVHHSGMLEQSSYEHMIPPHYHVFVT
jgi:hypothetical protein